MDLEIVKNLINTAGELIGNNAVGAAGGAGVVLFILWRVFRLGANREKAKQLQAGQQVTKARVKNDKKVKSLSNDDAKSELSKWVHKPD